MADEPPKRKSSCLLVFMIATTLFVMLVVARTQPIVWTFLWWRQSFDPVAWRSAKYTRYSIRYEMAFDLLCHHLPCGTPRAEVRRLLGPPDELPRHKGGDGYEIGSGVLGEYILLVFQYDEEGRVSRVEFDGSC